MLHKLRVPLILNVVKVSLVGIDRICLLQGTHILMGRCTGISEINAKRRVRK